jgi:hypothetical protein
MVPEWLDTLERHDDPAIEDVWKYRRQRYYEH